MHSNALQFKDPNVLPEARPVVKRRSREKQSSRTPMRELECKESFDLIDDASPWILQDSETLSALLSREQVSHIDTDQWPTLQPNLNPAMRAILGDWLMEISTEFMLKRETYHLALHFVDEFTQNSPGIVKSEYQLVGVAGLMIACKFEEVFVPKMADLELSTDRAYDKAQIRGMERKMLLACKWRLLSATYFHWMNWAMSQWDSFVTVSGCEAVCGFKTSTQQGYYLYRDAMQILDTLMLDYRHLKLRKNEVVACVLYLVLSRSQTDQSAFMQLFDYFAEQTLAVSGIAEVRHIFGYVSNFTGLCLNYALPKACHVLGQETLSSHYEEFLAYQTHNPHSVLFVKQLLQTL